MKRLIFYLIMTPVLIYEMALVGAVPSVYPFLYWFSVSMVLIAIVYVSEFIAKKTMP